MLKKELTYTDYNDVERKETFYFNINESELTKIQLSYPGGFREMLQKIVNEKNVPEIMKVYENLILMSYGEKSADGKRFEKSEEISKAFSQTPAYDKLFMELLSVTNEATNFIIGILPTKYQEEIRKQLEKENA